MTDLFKFIVQSSDKQEQMGSLKARMSSLPVVELELVYMGCLVAVVLAFPLRPTDMFRYTEPAASLLEPMMSDMIFAIANDSYPIEHFSPVDMVAMDNKKLLAGSRRIIKNGTTQLFLTYKSGLLGFPKDPRLLENNLPRGLDSTWLDNSPSMFTYVVSLSSPSKFMMSCYAWGYEASTSIQKETTLERFLNTSNDKIKGKTEEDKEIMGLFSSMNLNTTIIHYENYCEAYGQGCKLSKIMVIPQYGLFGAHPSSDNDLYQTTKSNTSVPCKSENMSHIYMILGVIGGIIIGYISILSWKYIKNLTCLGSSYESHSFDPFRSTSNEEYLTDHNVYERLLEEAIMVSSGSSGKVYKIKFLELECAMKVFFSHARMDFRREAVIVASLDHPNIIKFFCCFRKSFIIMELLDEDLYSFITKVREKTSDYELSLEVALDVMLQIAEGMSYLHEEGIAHQDLKSLNIFLKLQGEPHSSNFRIIAKIADFGSARSFDPRHPRGFFLRPLENVGTRSWRAPELFLPRGGFLSKVFGMACEILPKPLDIYGFAIICSELVTKQIPFSNTSEPRIVHGAELRAGVRPTLPSRGCPEELITLIEDCWQTNPQSRPEFNEICVRLRRLIDVQTRKRLTSAL